MLGAAAAGIGLAWIVARGGTAVWVSVPLLVLFPILIQLGFVFIGGQAGRLLDIAGIKASFPRIMAGFPVGAVIGGAGWRARQPARPRGGPAAGGRNAQAAFAGLVWATGRRYGAQLRLPGSGDGARGRGPADDENGPPIPARASRPGSWP